MQRGKIIKRIKTPMRVQPAKIPVEKPTDIPIPAPAWPVSVPEKVI